MRTRTKILIMGLIALLSVPAALWLLPVQEVRAEAITVTETFPPANVHTATVTSPVIVTYTVALTETLNAATVNTQTFAIHAMQTGQLTQTYSVNGGAMALTPNDAFFPGELVQATATTGTQSLFSNSPVSPTVWQFRTAVSGGSGYFADTGQTIANIYPGALALGDLDGDGDLDAFWGRKSAGASTVWMNDGTGVFSDTGQALGNTIQYEIALGDFDGDGDLDAVSGNSTNSQAWRNDGSGTFTLIQDLGTGQRAYGVAVGDVDGDGDLDIFLAHRGSGYNSRVWLNDGTGSFSDSGQLYPTFADVSLGDLDGDGDLDAFVGYDTDNNGYVLLNNGSGTFSDSGQTLSMPGFQHIALGDLDSDGDLDAFIANDGADMIWMNDGSGSFSDSGQALGSADDLTVNLGDLDADGDLDAFIGRDGNSPVVDVWLNDGAGTFAHSGQDFGNGYGNGAALGDLDGDGDLDAFFGQGYTVNSEVWLNREPQILTVDTTLDSNDTAYQACTAAADDCSLRGAISLANTNALTYYYTILIPPGTYVITQTGTEDANAAGDLDLMTSANISGTGASPSEVIIDGGGLGRILQLDTHRNILNLDNLTLQNGSEHYGGALYLGTDRHNTVRISNVVITACQASGSGGAIWNDNNDLYISDSLIANNTATFNGGGILMDWGDFELIDSIVENNQATRTDAKGGGLFLGRLTGFITNTVIRNNNSGQLGGGIYFSNPPQVTVQNSTISDNQAASDGGGIYHYANKVELINTTLSGNQSGRYGGAIYTTYSTVDLKLVNVTVTGNSADTGGGGLYRSANTLTISNTLVANNTAPTSPDCAGGITSEGHNLVEDPTDCNFTPQSTDLTGLDPVLGPLQDNGGDTETHALLTGSPAVGNGDCVQAFDQRGIVRPQGYACDIGAYEYDGAAFVAANDDAYSEIGDIPIAVAAPGLLLNDSGFLTPTVATAAAPQTGTVVVNADGSFIYTPTLNFSGVDTFVYTITDGTNTDNAIVRITIISNTVPEAIEDFYTTDISQTLVVPAPGVLANDSDADGHPITAVLDADVTMGTLTLDASGAFTYTPPISPYTGVATFTYHAHDGQDGGNVVTVTVLVGKQCTWTGVGSTAWISATNWSNCDGGVPGLTDHAIINNVTNDPLLDADVTIAAMTLNNNASLTISGTRTLSVTEKVIANRFSLSGAGVFSVNALEIDAGSNNVTNNGTMLVNRNLSIRSVGSINNNPIQVLGGVRSEDDVVGGSAFVRLIGDTDQTLSGPGVLGNLEVMKSGGDVVLANDFILRESGTLSGTGHIRTGDYWLIVGQQALNSNYTLNFDGTVEDLNVNVYYHDNRGQVRLGKDITVTGNLSVTSMAGLWSTDSNLRRLKVVGDVDVTDADGYYSETDARITLIGGSDQTLSSSGGGALMSLEVMKSGGDVVLANDFALRESGTLSGSGHIRTGDYWLIVGQQALNSNYTLNFDGTVEDLNVNVYYHDNRGQVRLGKDITVTGNLSVTSMAGLWSTDSNLRRLKVIGDVDVTDADGYYSETDARITLIGGSDQTLTSSGGGALRTVEVTKTAGMVLLGTDMGINALSIEAGDFSPNGLVFTGTTTLNGGQLVGEGLMVGNVTVNTGTLNAGGSPGVITVTGDLALNSGAVLYVDIDGETPGTGHDQVVVTGTVTVNDATLTGTLGTTDTVAGPLTIIANDAADAIVGSGFANAPNGGDAIDIGGKSYAVNYIGDTGNDLTLTAGVPNQAPSFGSMPVLTATEDITYTYIITATDPNVGDVLTIIAPTKPAWLSLSATVSGTASLSGTPGASDVGTHTVSLLVTDSGGLTDTQDFAVVVAAVPAQPPVVQSISPAANAMTVPVDSAISITYDQAMDAATVNTQTFAVYGQQSGWVTQAYSVSGNTVTLTPTTPFQINETVYVNATTGMLSLAGAAPLVATEWQFRTAVRGGFGNFVDSGQSLGSTASNEVSLGDVDGDGDLDAFLATNGANEVWLNDGSSNFSDSGQRMGAADSRGATLGDLDGDGDLDAYVVNNGVNTVWLNDGAGVFTDSGQSMGNGTAVSNRVDLGDLDGDGDLDAVVANPTNFDGNPSQVWLNDGTGTFSAGQSIASLNSYRTALGDLDGDGDLDIFISNGFWLASQSNQVWLNDGNANFTNTGQSLGSSASQAVDLGDLDGDGDLDAFVPNRNQPDKVWLNDGAGNFVDSGQSLASAANYSVALGDVDGDGDLDAFLGDRYAGNTVWRNDGSGSFTDSGQSLGVTGTHDAKLGDLDGDGDLDAFDAKGHDSNINTVWLNQDANQAPSFTSTPVTTATEDVAYSYLVTASDPDAGDVVMITAQMTLPTWLSLSATVSGTATLAGTPSASDVGTYPISLLVTDSGGLTDTQNFVVVVSQASTNMPPVAVDDNFAVDQNSSDNILDVLANDYDLDFGDVVAFSGVGTPDQGGTVVLSGTTHLRYTPGADFVGTEVFSYTISDGHLTDTAIVTVAVKRTCTEADLLARVAAGESSGTISLDGECTYALTSANDDGYGVSGFAVFQATHFEGNGAVIERGPDAERFRVMRVAVEDGITIRNLTLKGGYPPRAYGGGGGMHAEYDTALENVHFENNKTDWMGGGFQNTYQSTTTMTDVVFINNQSVGEWWSNGGAIDNSGLLNINGGQFINNVGELGSAITALPNTNWRDQPNGQIVNSLFVDNTGRSTIWLVYTDLVNCTFANREKSPDIGVYADKNFHITNTIFANYNTGLQVTNYPDLSTSSVAYNLFAGNDTDFEYTTLYWTPTWPYFEKTLSWGTHNISVEDAQFVNPAGNDYRLKQNSAAVDQGLDTGLALDIDGHVRPYTGSSVDIGAYEYQGLGLPAQGIPLVAIRKDGPSRIMVRPMRFEVTVANEGVMPASDLQVVDQLPDGAHYVAGSASAGAIFTDGTLMWDIGDLNSGESTKVSYLITATQTLTSDNYYASSSSTPDLYVAGEPVVTERDISIIAELGFLPQPDGFSFPNYGDSPDSDLTTDDVAYIFGADAACKTQNPCELSASAEQWRSAWLDFVTGGHCAGMAMGSLSIFENDAVSPGDFQADAQTTYDLAKANARRFIALYATTQVERPLNRQDLYAQGLYDIPVVREPVVVLDFLIDNFSDPDAPDRYRLSIRKADGSGGHAVTPYLIRRISAEENWIYVYDNNFPNDFARVIKINRAANTWIYEGANTRPDAPKSTYSGDATSNNIGVRSLVWAESFPKDFDRRYVPTMHGPAATQAATTTLKFQLDGAGYLLITRSDGQRAGYDPLTGELIAEISGTVEIPVSQGPRDNTMPIIEIPNEAGMTYNVQIANRQANFFGNTEAVATLNIFGPGAVTRLQGMRIDTAPPTEESTPEGVHEEMQVTLNPATNRLTFQNSALDAETPKLTMAIDNPDGADYTFEVDAMGLDAGETVAMAFNEATGQLSVENDSVDSDSYAVSVERLNSDGTRDTFESDGISDGDGVGAVIDVGDSWDGVSEPVIEVNYTPTLTPVLSLHKSVDTSNQAAVPLGGVVTYTLVISNSGSGLASGVMLTDVLPTGIESIGWIEQGSAVLPQRTIQWGPWNVPARTDYTLIFAATVTSDDAFAGQTVTNTATLSADNHGAGTSGPVTFTIAAMVPTNEVPQFTSTPVETATVGAPYTYTVTASDPDAGDTLSLTATTLPAWLSLTDQRTGAGPVVTATLAGTPTVASDGRVVLHVSDGISTATQAFTITVSAVEDTTPPTFPAGDVLLAPADGTTVTKHPVVLRAAPATDNVGVVRYDFQVVLSSTLRAPLAATAVYTSTTSSYTFTVDLPNGVYTWTVRAIDAAGNASSWVTPWATFTVDVPKHIFLPLLVRNAP